MLRTTVLHATAAALLFGVGALAGVSQPGALAQAGTPQADELEAAAGVMFAPLAFGIAAELPATPAGLSLLRATFDPGASLPIEAADSSVALAYVEVGTLTIRVEAPVTVLRSADSGTEDVDAGAESTLQPGDSVVLPPHVAGEIRNDGVVPAVALAALVELLPAADGGTPVS